MFPKSTSKTKGINFDRSWLDDSTRVIVFHIDYTLNNELPPFRPNTPEDDGEQGIIHIGGLRSYDTSIHHFQHYLSRRRNHEAMRGFVIRNNYEYVELESDDEDDGDEQYVPIPEEGRAYEYGGRIFAVDHPIFRNHPRAMQAMLDGERLDSSDEEGEDDENVDEQENTPPNNRRRRRRMSDTTAEEYHHLMLRLRAAVERQGGVARAERVRAAEDSAATADEGGDENGPIDSHEGGGDEEHEDTVGQENASEEDGASSSDESGGSPTSSEIYRYRNNPPLRTIEVPPPPPGFRAVTLPGTFLTFFVPEDGAAVEDSEGGEGEGDGEGEGEEEAEEGQEGDGVRMANLVAAVELALRAGDRNLETAAPSEAVDEPEQGEVGPRERYFFDG